LTKRAVGRADTKAELELRRALWALGLRYRKNVAALPGCPDIVFAHARVAVFVDGDFWHGRDWAARARKLERGANATYWQAKIAANRARDRRKCRELQADGWTVVRAWETDVLDDPASVAQEVAAIVHWRCGGRPGVPLRILSAQRLRVSSLVSGGARQARRSR
jgi:DNA mismatch endonuclease (patch repair protein)